MILMNWKAASLLFIGILAVVTYFTGVVSAPEADGNSSFFIYSKLYVDGFSADSSGVKLLLRAQRQPLYAQPFLLDIDFILMSGNTSVYKDSVKQKSLIDGSGEFSDNYHIALTEGQNYTALAKVYLYENGSPGLYLTTTSSFTAKSDAVITEVYGDSIGASATFKGTSMVPLNGTITFTLSRDGKEMEIKKAAAPAILSHDKDKTTSILWDRKLDEGTYMVSVVLSGKDLDIKYDKIFNVERKAAVQTTVSPMQQQHSIPGFTGGLTAAVFVSAYIRRKLKA